MMKCIAAVSLIYLTSIVGPGASLLCYECNFLNNTIPRKACMDPFFRNSSLLKPCTPWDIGCVKYDTIVSGIKVVTSRGCVTYEELNFIQKWKLNGSDSLEFCNTDGCNDSQSLKSSVVVMIFTAAVMKCLLYGLR